jgi:flap endonuclease-1
MGIPGLPKLISNITDGEAMKQYEFSHFNGMTVGIDTSILVHRTGIGIRGSGQDMTNAAGGLTSHLNGIFYKILKFLENNMTPIFVFDGQPSHLKNKTIKKRTDDKLIATEKLSTVTDEKDYITCFKQSFCPSKDDYVELQIMLDLMGIPYILAPEEADPVLAWLSTRKDKRGNRIIKGVCTEDTDIMVLGAPYVFKNMFGAMSSKNTKVSIMSLRTTLSKMNLTMDQFVDMSVLMGCDYCDRIKTIGPKKSYDLIRSKKNLAGATEYLKNEAKKNKKIDIDKKNIECMFEAADFFKKALDDLDNNDDFVVTNHNIRLRTYQQDELLNFMCVKHNFDTIRIQSMIRRLSIYYNKMNVTRPNKTKVHEMINSETSDYAFLSSDSESSHEHKKKKKIA